MLHAGAQQHPLGVVAAARRLGHGRRAVGGQRREQHARLDLRAGDGQLVVDRAQARRRAPSAARSARRAPRARAPISRSGSAMRSTGPAADRVVAVERERAAVLRGEPARAAGAAACPALPTSIGPSGSRASRRPVPRIDDLARRAARRARRARARPRASSGVGRVQVALDPHRLGGHRAEQRRAVGDRLVGRRRAALPVSPPRGLEAHVHAAALMPAPPGKPSSRDQLLARARRARRRRSTARRRPGGCRPRARAPCRRC